MAAGKVEGRSQRLVVPLDAVSQGGNGDGVLRRSLGEPAHGLVVVALFSVAGHLGRLSRRRRRVRTKERQGSR